jgi:hypothetical protein
VWLAESTVGRRFPDAGQQMLTGALRVTIDDEPGRIQQPDNRGEHCAEFSAGLAYEASLRCADRAALEPW